MSHKFYFKLFVPIIFLISVCIGEAQISLPKIFSNHGILQRDKEILFYGKAKPKTDVKVVFNDRIFKTKAGPKGNWKVVFPPSKAGGPYEISVFTRTDTIVLKDILIGDIWLAGGQSNMEWPVEGAKNAETEIANSDYPQVRIFDVPHKMATTPLDTLEPAGWHKVTPESVKQFSAIGYFFGRNLHKELDIPVGIISDNWGGTVIETWMSKDAFRGMPGYREKIQKLKNINLEKEKIKRKKAFDSWIEDFHKLDKGIENNEYIWAKKNTNYNTWKEMSLPGIWEMSNDSSLHGQDGVVWFEKEIYLSEDPGDKRIILSLGAIDDSDKTWVNGVLVGEKYKQYNKNRLYDIPKNILKKGDNKIVIRVEDYMGEGGFTADKDMFFISIGERKIPLAGKWKYKVGMLVTSKLQNNVFGPNIYPTLLYNGMINPIINFAIKGVIWYQGESNAYNAYEYRYLFKRWIKDWRRQWNDNLPVLWVQLANFRRPPEEPTESLWAELRESQAKGLELDNTAMITAIDLGEAKTIHPKNKQGVAKRLSDAALNTVYRLRDFHFMGPVYSNSKITGHFIEITFDNTGDKLIAKDKYGYVKGFTIAGKNKKFHWAKALIIGKNKIKVWSDDVKNPVAVRYAWADNPEDANLYNSFNLPAYPFRTDNWKLSSQKDKGDE